jgi:hypothetical protein
MAFKQPYNNFNKQGASIAPAAAAVPAAAKGIGALLAKLGIGAKKAAAGSKVALSKGGDFLAKFGKGKDLVGKGKDLVGPIQPKQGFIKQASSKISKGYNQKISDIAKNLDTDYDKVDQFVKGQVSSKGSEIVSRVKSKKEEDEVIPSYSSGKTTIINTTNNKSYGYGNPQGPSQGYSNPSAISKSDQALNAITPKKNDFISNFKAPVNVQGITFDAGDAVRAARLLARAIENRKPRSSRFKELSDKDIKSSVAKHEYEQDLKYKPGGDAMGDTNFSYSKKGLGGKIQEYKIRKNKTSKPTSAKSSSVKPTTIKPTPVKPTSTESTSKFYNAKSKRKNRLENKKRFKTNTKNLIAGK